MVLEETQRLIREAMEARKNSYCPYSHYAVGAALLTADGSVIRGTNVENASYGATVCAERSALFAAVSAGQRQFRAIAVVSGRDSVSNENLSAPGMPYPSCCGICRQALREFVNPSDFQVILARSTTDWRRTTLEALLPGSFGPDYL